MANNSYQPLFLKYRPQALEDILGQNSVKETLVNAIKNQKIVHAYLLTGPRGSGKTSSARILAKSLNCLEPCDKQSPTVFPCGECSNCVSIANSSSIDVIEIDAASHGHVEDARNLIEKVNLASVSGKYKVYIIDEVHMLTTSAFNALLKVIEEPPNNVVFILATTELDKVPKTISSRCQQLRFKPISINDAIARLNHVSQKENININEDAIKLIAEHSDGAMRDALSLLDQLSVFSLESKSIDKDKVYEILGTVPSQQLNILISSIVKRNQQELFDSLNSLLSAGKDPLIIVKELGNHFLLLLEAVNSSSSNPIFTDLISLIKQETIENFELVQIIESLAELEIRIKQTANSKNLLRAWLLKIAHRADILVVKDLMKRIEALESGSSSRGSTVAATMPKQVKTNNGHYSNDSEIKMDKVIVNNIEPEPKAKTTDTTQMVASSFMDYLSPGTRGMYVSSHAQLSSVNGNTALIYIPSKYKFLKSKLEDRREEICSAISKEQGISVSVLNIEISDEAVSVATEVNTSTVDMSVKSDSSSKLDEIVSAGIGFFGGKEIV